MQKKMCVEPVTLKGQRVILAPLELGHVPALSRVGLDASLWEWIPAPVTTEQEMRGYVLSALELQGRGVALPFAILDRASGDVIGSTRYANIESAHRRLEIGWTWITRAHQRTAVNTEAKVLLLEHAFETLRVQRVELKTDACNARSREAILRLGAAQEGVLRRHMITRSGRVRDTVYFSIIDTEWPAVKGRLEARLKRATPDERSRT